VTVAAVVVLCVLVAFGAAVKVLEFLGRRPVERHTISVRDFPNIAPPMIDTIGAAAPSPAVDRQADAA
jgi:hypothetical protein